MKTRFLSLLCLLLLLRWCWPERPWVQELAIAVGALFFLANLRAFLQVYQTKKNLAQAFELFIEKKVGPLAAQTLRQEAMVMKSALNFLRIYPTTKLRLAMQTTVYNRKLAETFIVFALLLPVEAVLGHLLLQRLAGTNLYLHLALLVLELYFLVLGCGYYNLRSLQDKSH